MAVGVCICIKEEKKSLFLYGILLCVRVCVCDDMTKHGKAYVGMVWKNVPHKLLRKNLLGIESGRYSHRDLKGRIVS